jgi:hypothetical protein
MIRHFRSFVTTVKGRTVAESNASLLEAFSQIIRNPRHGDTSAFQTTPMLRSANALVPAPEFNGKDGKDGELVSNEFGGTRFRPGDVLLCIFLRLFRFICRKILHWR